MLEYIILLREVKLPILNKKWVVVTTFFLHAFFSGALLSRMPDIQASAGLDKTGLGVVMLGQPVGAILIFLLGSRFIEKIGTKPILLGAIPLLAVCLAALPFVAGIPMLLAVFAVFGAAFAISNVSMNVEADRAEALLGQRIINLCHGVWSLGLLLTSLLGTLLRARDVGVQMHLALLVVPAIILVEAIVGPTPAAPPRDHAGATKRRIISLPTPRVLALVGFLLGATLLEVAARNWSVIFMRDAFAAPAWVDTLALPAFLIAQASGRIFADGWATRYGPVRVGQALSGVALLGLVTVVLSPSLPVALLGFLIIGVGVCAAFPSAASAAARIGDRPSSENVASLTLATQLVLLSTPALLGYIADASGPRAMYAIVLPLLVLGFFCARTLEPDRQNSPHPAAPVAAK